MCKRCRRKRLGGGLPQQVLTRALSSQTITVFLGHQNVWQIVHGGSWPCLLGDEMCPWEAAISEARLGPQKGLGGADKIVSPSSENALLGRAVSEAGSESRCVSGEKPA